MYIQYSTHTKHYLNLGIYLGNVLYCRFAFMDSLDSQLIFERGWSPVSALQLLYTFYHKISFQKTGGRYIQQRMQTKNNLHQLCTQVLYSIVASHLWIRLIFSSSSKRAEACLRRFNSCTHSITKQPTRNCRQVHTIEHTH